MLAFECHGSGEPLVLVHGITHRRQAWYPVLDQLAENREVVLVDLPGHGASPDFSLEGRTVVEALRNEFKSFLDALGLDRPHVAGNSLGGRIALEAGVAGHARSVTALSPAGFWHDEASFAYTRRLFTSAATASEKMGPRADVLARTRSGRALMYGLLMSRPGRIPGDHALGDFRAFERARPTMRVLLDAATPFVDEIPVEIPVTIAWAARDLVLPRWQAEVAKQRLPHAEHILMRGVGHVPMFDNPEFVAKVLLRGSEPAATVAPIAAVTPLVHAEPVEEATA